MPNQKSAPSFPLEMQAAEMQVKEEGGSLIVGGALLTFPEEASEAQDYLATRIRQDRYEEAAEEVFGTTERRTDLKTPEDFGEWLRNEARSFEVSLELYRRS